MHTYYTQYLPIESQAAVSSVRDPYATLFVDNLDPRVSEALLYELFVQVLRLEMYNITCVVISCMSLICIYVYSPSCLLLLCVLAE